MELDDRQQLRHAARELAEIAGEVYGAFLKKGLPERLGCDLTLEMVRVQLLVQAQANMTDSINGLMKKMFPEEES